MNSNTQQVEKRRKNEATKEAEEEDRAKKRRKTHAVSRRDPCLLLDFSPEIQRRVYSFLSLKEGMEVRRTCRQIHSNENTKLDVFRYCIIMNWEPMEAAGFEDRAIMDYSKIQMYVLCNLGSIDKLRAVLRNETLAPYADVFIWNMADLTKTDNAEAISILLQDKRFPVTIDALHQALKNGLTEAAAVLEEDERIKKDIRMCTACARNIACYSCPNVDHHNRLNPDGPKMYCSGCVPKESPRCISCKEYMCPKCVAGGRLHRCEKCGCICCSGNYLCEEEMHFCVICDRNKCVSCATEDGDDWRFDSVLQGEDCRECTYGSD